MKTKDARSLPPKAQEAIRIKAVEAVISGKKQVEVSQIFGITRQALGKWVKAYRGNGIKALKAKRQGRPKGGSLLPWQAAQIAKTVIDRTPEQLKFPFYLWTREAVAQLIEQRFDKSLSIWTVGRYLTRIFHESFKIDDFLHSKLNRWEEIPMSTFFNDKIELNTGSSPL